MVNKAILWRASYFAYSAMLLLITFQIALAAEDNIVIEIDKTTNPKPLDPVMAERIEKLGGAGPICLDLKVRMDGKVPDALRRSAEEDNPHVVSRDIVPCGPVLTGHLTMGPGIEYYLITQGRADNRIDLSIYPGSRTEHISNDVACVLDEDGQTVWFTARGLYRPLRNRYAEVDHEGKATGRSLMSIQLRPLVGSREETAACPKNQ